MSLVEILLIAMLALLCLVLILQALQLLRRQVDPVAMLHPRLDALDASGERLAKDVRADQEGTRNALRDEQRAARGELAQAMEQLRGGVQQQFVQLAAQQHQRIEGFGTRLDQFTQRTDQGLEALRQGLAEDARKTREDGAVTLQRFGEFLQQRLSELSQRNEGRLVEMRGTLDEQLKALQADTARQLEMMRATVEEKLQTTLETRLGESFRLVSERLEQVHRGLGEMQGLAAGVGDLKRVLSNVRTRGTFGEVQLGALLEQMLTAEQYASNVCTVPGSTERVEFAVRLPGGSDERPVWLPVDAKFPREDYERLLDAHERADADGAAIAGAALERRVREEAKRIRSKYISPPHTTDFALLFLPTEGLYAEVLRRPGLSEILQREMQVIVAGPTTLAALLNSLQLGFRTLAIEKRSSEVWILLGAVKTEFGKFAGVLEKTKSQLDNARNNIDELVGKRTRAIERKLRGVESLGADQSQKVLGEDGFGAEADE
jgi:DNA recombination protein RmuC